MSEPRHALLRTLPWAMLALLLPAPAAAQVQGYRLDPIHTRIVFAIDHAGFSTALGSISGSTGVVAFDPLDWSSARLDVRVPLRRVDLGDKRWNRAAARMLGSASHPEARFIASDVRAVDASHARACGTLYLHGTQQPLCLEVRFNQAGREPLPPFHHKAGFSATATLSRAAFGIDAWAALVGDEVELRIEAEAARDDAALAELPPVPRK